VALGTSVFSGDWAYHHRPAVESSFTARVKIERVADEGRWNQATGEYDGAGMEALYLGWASIERVARPTRRDFVFDSADNQMVRVQLPLDENEADPVDLRWQSNDILTVLENDTNHMMVGEKLFLHGWIGSSHDWLHTLHFTTNAKQDGA